MLSTRLTILTSLLLVVTAATQAQDVRVGVAMPFSLTGQLLQTRRPKPIESTADTLLPAFHINAAPTLTLGQHWYFYSAFDVTTEPFSYYEAYYPDRETEHHVRQAFLAYRWPARK